MLSFFRRFLRSRYGAPVTVGFMILLMAGFGLGDLSSYMQGGPSATNDVATVGRDRVGVEEVRDRVQQAFQNERQRNPDITIQQFLAQGGLELVIESMETGVALDQFADTAGLVAGKRLIDGEIASAPDFLGLDGKFDQAKYEQFLQQGRLTDATIRRDFARQTLAGWIVRGPFESPYVPAQLAQQYTRMLFEHRTGSVVLVSAAAMPAAAAPSDQQLNQYYTTNRQRYIVPERRAVRYALVTADAVKAQTAPTDAELQAAYKAAGDKYSAVEKRTIVQLVVLDQASANGIAAKIKGGIALDKAARDAGLSAVTLKDVTKAGLATQSSAALADAAFAATKGGLIGPLKSGTGWTLAVVDAITASAGTSFEAARAELTPPIVERKTAQLLNQMAETIDSESTGSTFDEIVKDNKLTPATTPALLANGTNPDDAAATPDPKLAPVLKAAFAMAADDDPTVVQLGTDNSFAVVKLDRIIAAAPRALASIKDRVAKDYQLDQQLRLAREAANKVVRAVNGGSTLEAALASTGVKASAPAKLDLDRGQVVYNPQIPAEARALFSLKPKQARLIDAPNRAGFVIVYNASVRAGAADAIAKIVPGEQQQLAQQSQEELQRQLLTAIRKQTKIVRNGAAVQTLRNDLGGVAEE